MNRIFSFLTPKENKFFPLITSIGKILQDTSTELLDFIKCNDKDKMAELYAKIKNYERASDSIVNEIFVELNDTFITPFDREDIQILCERLDDTLDSMNSAAKRVLIFQPKIIPKETVEMCQIIADCCDAIVLALGELKTLNKTSEEARKQCDILHDLEQKGDELYEEYIRAMFESCKNTVELIKMQGIMQELERATDMAHSVGKIIKTIIVKYA